MQPDAGGSGDWRKLMAFKIKLSHQRRPRGLHALAEKNRAAAALMAAGGELERAEAESELVWHDALTATEKLVKLDAENVAGMDHVGGLLDALHADLDSIERDLNEYIEKEAK
jgi:hypothetical protein